MKTDTPLTAFEYLYRDAANYKAFGLVVLRGTSTDGDLTAIQGACEAQTYFIAEQVDIAPLYAQLYEFSGGPTEDDHVFHEFIGLRAATSEDGKPSDTTVAELVRRFQEAGLCWDYTRSRHWDLGPWR